MNIKSQYDSYISYLYSKIRTLDKEADKLKEELTTIKQYLVNAKNKFSNLSCSYEDVINLNISVVELTKNEDDIKSEILVKYCNNYINFKRQYNSNLKLMKILYKYTSSSKQIFNKVLEEYYLNIAKIVLLGGKYDFGKNISSIYIKEVKCQYKTDNLLPDWGKSNKNKKELIRQGKTPQNLTNGVEGEKWIEFKTGNSFAKIRWEKKNCRIKNKSIFSFVPANTMHNKGRNYKSLFEEITCQEDIIYHKKVGLNRKKVALLEYNKDIINKYKLN